MSDINTVAYICNSERDQGIPAFACLTNDKDQNQLTNLESNIHVTILKQYFLCKLVSKAELTCLGFTFMCILFVMIIVRMNILVRCSIFLKPTNIGSVKYEKQLKTLSHLFQMLSEKFPK